MHRGELFLLFENQAEVIGGRKPAQLRDFFDAFFCAEQKLLGFGNANRDQEINQSAVHILFKRIRERGF